MQFYVSGQNGTKDSSVTSANLTVCDGLPRTATKFTEPVSIIQSELSGLFSSWACRMDSWRTIPRDLYARCALPGRALDCRALNSSRTFWETSSPQAPGVHMTLPTWFDFWRT